MLLLALDLGHRQQWVEVLCNCNRSCWRGPAVLYMLLKLTVPARTTGSSVSTLCASGLWEAVSSGLPICPRRVPSVTCLGASCLTHDRFNQLESSTFKACSCPRGWSPLSFIQLLVPFERFSAVLTAAEVC